MPRGIPKNKPADTKPAAGKKPGPKTSSKALADKLANQITTSTKPVGVQATQPLPLQQPSILPRVEATTTQSSPVKGNAVMTPVSPAVAEAIAKIEATFKPNQGMGRPFHDMPNRRDCYMSVVGQKKGLRQTATLYLNGEALASTQDYRLSTEYCAEFLIGDKFHTFTFGVESNLYYDISNYTGVLLSPVDRTEVEKIIKNSDKTALALAEDEVVILLQQERPVFKRGDVVAHMIDKGPRYLVLEAPQPVDQYRHRPQPFGRDEAAVELDMVVMELMANYDHNNEASVVGVAQGPKKVYSGMFLLAE
jgi:hypothetical protein